MDDARWRRFEQKREAVSVEQARLAATWLRPGTPAGEDAARVIGAPLEHEYSLMDLLRRPNVGYAALMSVAGAGPGLADARPPSRSKSRPGIRGYLERQRQEVERHAHNESLGAAGRL